MRGLSGMMPLMHCLDQISDVAEHHPNDTGNLGCHHFAKWDAVLYTVSFFSLFSNASTVAIDNKIEQAMVSAMEKVEYPCTIKGEYSWE